MVLGDPLLPLIPVALHREPLAPEAKARILAEMPFVSEPVGQDLLDLADATPTGSRARMLRIGLGVALGAVAGYLACNVVRGSRRSRSLHSARFARA